jgi:hypothetical protein
VLGGNDHAVRKVRGSTAAQPITAALGVL